MNMFYRWDEGQAIWQCVKILWTKFWNNTSHHFINASLILLQPPRILYFYKLSHERNKLHEWTGSYTYLILHTYIYYMYIWFQHVIYTFENIYSQNKEVWGFVLQSGAALKFRSSLIISTQCFWEYCNLYHKRSCTVSFCIEQYVNCTQLQYEVLNYKMLKIHLLTNIFHLSAWSWKVFVVVSKYAWTHPKTRQSMKLK